VKLIAFFFLTKAITIRAIFYKGESSYYHIAKAMKACFMFCLCITKELIFCQSNESACAYKLDGVAD
jgi:hypothetical protein